MKKCFLRTTDRTEVNFQFTFLYSSFIKLKDFRFARFSVNDISMRMKRLNERSVYPFFAPTFSRDGSNRNVYANGDSVDRILVRSSAC